MKKLAKQIIMSGIGFTTMLSATGAYLAQRQYEALDAKVVAAEAECPEAIGLQKEFDDWRMILHDLETIAANPGRVEGFQPYEQAVKNVAKNYTESIHTKIKVLGEEIQGLPPEQWDCVASIKEAEAKMEEATGLHASYSGFAIFGAGVFGTLWLMSRAQGIYRRKEI